MDAAARHKGVFRMVGVCIMTLIQFAAILFGLWLFAAVCVCALFSKCGE